MSRILESDRSFWRTVRFDKMAESITDRVDDPSKAGVDRYVGLEHLDPESLRIARWGSPADVGATKLRFQSGDIIFGRRRAYQRKLAVADFDGICSAHALVLRARPDILSPEFLPFFMQSDMFFDRALAISVGSLSPTINWTTLAKEEFALPPLDEQRRIAEVLWSMDHVLERWQLVLAKEQTLLQAIRAKRICSADFPRIELGNCLLSITPGKSVVGSNVAASHHDCGVLKVSAVGPNGFRPAENKRLLDPSEFRREFSVRQGDLLITRANTRELVGRACLVPNDHPNLMLCDKTLRLEANRNVVIPEFLFEVLCSAETRAQIESIASGTGGAMKNISQRSLRRLRIPLPSIVEQKRIATLITDLGNNLDQVTSRVEVCKSLLQQAREHLIFRSSKEIPSVL